jgi:CRISPR type III-A-associated protein Csm2
MQEALKKAGVKAGQSEVSGKGKSERTPNFYYEEVEGELVIRQDLLTDKARMLAESFIRPGGNRDNPYLTSAQLRRFYGEAKSLEARVKAKGFTVMKPLVKMMKSKVAYACPIQGKRKVPQEFRDFMEQAIDNVNNKEDFEAFMHHFESVVGFFYGQGGRER